MGQAAADVLSAGIALVLLRLYPVSQEASDRQGSQAP